MSNSDLNAPIRQLKILMKTRFISLLATPSIALAIVVASPPVQAQAAKKAVGIMKALFKEAAGIASEQAIKTSTEEAVKQGYSLPVEAYDLSHSFGYYNEQTWGYYAGKRLPLRNLTIWNDPVSQSDIKYSLEIDGVAATTGPTWFEEQKRAYHCLFVSSAGTLEEWHLVTYLVYRGYCNVITPNISHAVSQHPAKIFWAGPVKQSDCTTVPDAWQYYSLAKSIGRGSYASFGVPSSNFRVDYQYIGYE